MAYAFVSGTVYFMFVCVGSIKKFFAQVSGRQLKDQVVYVGPFFNRSGRRSGRKARFTNVYMDLDLESTALELLKFVTMRVRVVQVLVRLRAFAVPLLHGGCCSRGVVSSSHGPHRFSAIVVVAKCTAP